MASPAHPVANAAAAYSTFASLCLGRAAQTVVGGLIWSGDSRNINKNGEFTGITILLLDEMVMIVSLFPSFFFTQTIRHVICSDLKTFLHVFFYSFVYEI